MIEKKLLGAVAAVMAVTGAWAQTTGPVRPQYVFPGTPATQQRAGAVEVGDTPLFLTPWLNLAGGRDDNLFLSNANKKKSNLYIVSPGLKLDARDANKVFDLTYQGTIGRYTSSSEDDYVDHTTRLSFDTAFTPRAFAHLGYNHFRWHDPRGSTDRAISNQPDRYMLQGPNGIFAFGAPGAQGRVEVYASDMNKHYLNNLAVASVSNKDIFEFGGAYYWRVAPRTYVLAEARKNNIHYQLPGSPFSGNEQRYYGGVTWEATAATTGTLKVGRLRKSFDIGLPDFTGTSWEALVSWLPRTYSKFDVYTARQTNDSTGLGNFILTDIYGVTWSHAWQTVLSTDIFARHQRDDYQGFPRNDKTNALGLKVGYRFRRWMALGAEYAHTKRTSNVPIYEYDKNLYLVTAILTM